MSDHEEVRAHGVDPGIIGCIVNQYRRLDARHVSRRRGRTVERHHRLQVRTHLHGEVIDRPAAEAEAGRPQRARGQRMRLQEPGAVQQVGQQFIPVQAGLQRLARIIVAGIAADRRQAVGCQGEKSLHRHAPCHILDMRVQAPVLVNHQDGGKRPRPLRLHQIAPHPARCAAGGVIVDVLRRDAWIGEGDLLRLRIARQQRLRHGRRRDTADQGQGRRPLQKFPPRHLRVAVFVIEIEDPGIDVVLFHCLTPSPVSGIVRLRADVSHHGLASGGRLASDPARREDHPSHVPGGEHA